jgi:hypothetical protein
MKDWKDYVTEVEENGLDNASPIARLIYCCETGQGVDQHASIDLLAIVAELQAAADALAAKDARIAYSQTELYKATGCEDDNRPLEALVRLAVSQLAAREEKLDAWKRAYLKLEFDETTGECVMECGGDAAEGHYDGCLFIEWMPDGELPITESEGKE